jgi:hypothetical protein
MLAIEAMITRLAVVTPAISFDWIRIVSPPVK